MEMWAFVSAAISSLSWPLSRWKPGGCERNATNINLGRYKQAASRQRQDGWDSCFVWSLIIRCSGEKKKVNYSEVKHKDGGGLWSVCLE